MKCVEVVVLKKYGVGGDGGGDCYGDCDGDGGGDGDGTVGCYVGGGRTEQSTVHLQMQKRYIAWRMCCSLRRINIDCSFTCYNI